MTSGPLAGIKVVEFTGIGPAPYGCMLLAELGASVIRVDRPGGGGLAEAPMGPLFRSRPRLELDLKSPEGRAAVLRLAERADVLVEGLRPGVTERLGVGPGDCLAVNPGLVYARMTGWGQEGPLAQRAGHDITYSALTGALHMIGPRERPVQAVNLVADFGGGALFLVVGVLAALLERGRSGKGQVVDAAMVDGAASLTTMLYGMLGTGFWVDERQANLLDGGAPFYDTYRCADGRFVAVGALEPQFYAALVAGLGVTPEGGQYDRDAWPAHREAFAAAFATRTRDEWAAVFEGTDACVAPVLAMREAPHHPHMAARGTFTTLGGVTQPVAAPRFSRTPALAPTPPGDTGPALAGWGFTADEIKDLAGQPGNRDT
ncbi:CaiB/BaiF CoA-transferase family protein [Dactylosporangium fulvum]|uniref:CoA transferase n=1 Tax=Dactylosporangium fulvum TaxID=53359 RepID=A0ABY5VQT3_9ACTN|nr:CaiB/BaiF CoA-transferase family protein [Dactylosporangium fulvum]UWP79444.1 CoA transferase [Dactylosporangium fulvum]